MLCVSHQNFRPNSFVQHTNGQNKQPSELLVHKLELTASFLAAHCNLLSGRNTLSTEIDHSLLYHPPCLSCKWFPYLEVSRNIHSCQTWQLWPCISSSHHITLPAEYCTKIHLMPCTHQQALLAALTVVPRSRSPCFLLETCALTKNVERRCLPLGCWTSCRG